MKRTKLTTELFIERAIAIHGDKYDYSLVDYKTAHTKVKIICSKHGVFEQKPMKHTQGQGCRLCSIDTQHLSQRYDTDTFIKKAKSVHGDRYDYSKVQYSKSTVKVKIICSKHGAFEQVPTTHLRGGGCKKCALMYTAVVNKSTKADFVRKAVLTHGYVYDYTNSVFIADKKPIEIGCKKHGTFKQIPNNHTQGSGCPICGNQNSSQEEALASFVEQYATIKRNSRSELDGFELDIYAPDYNFAIEYNGAYWHSERQKNRQYHKNKYLLCKDRGIRLLQIWDYDWLDTNKQEIYKSIIRHHLGVSSRVYARHCVIANVDFRTAKQFYNDNHLKGCGQLSRHHINKALIYKGAIVGLVSIKGAYLSRMVFAKNTAVIGGVSKMLSSLPSGSYYTYIDCDLGGSGTQYKNAKVTTTDIGYMWYKSHITYTRQSMQKHKLKKLFQDYDGSSEISFLHKKGYFRLFNSGNLKVEFSV